MHTNGTTVKIYRVYITYFAFQQHFCNINLYYKSLLNLVNPVNALELRMWSGSEVVSEAVNRRV